jgi:hypothetical protein
LEALLTSNLLRREAELKADADALALVNAPLLLEQRQRELEFATDALEKIEIRIQGNFRFRFPVVLVQL